MTDIYRAIADPIRRKILRMVSQQECTQSDIVASFSISQPAIKKHLAILLEEQLLLERRVGKFCYYRLNTPVFQQAYLQLQSELGLVLDNKLAGLKHYLENLEEE
ncbi:metalloregulator ArsR/SmtB family transcription factor [Paenibacillus agilis]|uniref:Winged helix-turn-helix transcriptional regulator n=1 Tax=Paenibacillus agilis TaxID=3020863 RepID=A0A559IWW6_9BACL|nr:metalloregulator ArsR/SmtB family transcription factor [Paenibacillus agilis]TVX92081.1 winged helix-turn-helix transcriptional regulator [Paenibacillus agilis]